MAGYNLAKLYQGGTLTTSQAERIGQRTAATSRGIAQTRRRLILERGLRSGTIKQEDLGPLDKSELGLTNVKLPKRLGEGSLISKISGGFVNLGEDIYEAGKQFLPSLVETAKSVGSDIVKYPMQPWAIFNDESKTKKDVVNPIVENYKYTYSGSPREILGKIYQHPLGPILDVATVLSLGTLGAATGGARLAQASTAGSRPAEIGLRLAKITSREGRSPISVKGLTGETGEIPRDYARTPLRKASQKAEDALAARVSPLQRLQELHYTRKHQRQQNNQMEAAEAVAIEQALNKRSGDPPKPSVSKRLAYRLTHGKKFFDPAYEGLGPLVKHMDEEQNMALILILSGINTPAKLATLQNSIRKTLENEHPEDQGMNWNELRGLFDDDPSYLEFMAQPPARVRELVERPDEIMEEAAEAWAEIAARNAEDLGLEPEVTMQHVLRQAAQLEEQRLGPVPEPVLEYYNQLRIRAEREPQVMEPQSNRTPDPPAELIDIEDIAPFSEWDRSPGSVSARTDDEYQALRDDIQRNGIRHPLRIRVDPKTGKGYLHEGNMRLAVARELGIKQVPVVIDRGYAGMAPNNPDFSMRSLPALPEGRLGGDPMSPSLFGLGRRSDPRLEKADEPKQADSGVARHGPVPEPVLEYYKQLREGPDLDEALDEIDEIRTQYPQIDQIAALRNPDTMEEAVGPLMPENYKIAPNYVPHSQPQGWEAKERRGGGIKVSQPNKKQVGAVVPDRTPKNLFTPTSPQFMHESTGAAFLSGAFRIDRGALLEHIRDVKRAAAKDLWNEETLKTFAARNEDGETMEFKNDREMRNALGSGWTLIAPRFPYQFYRAEQNMLENSLAIIGDLERRGITDLDEDAIRVLEDLQDQHAAAFVRSNWGALKRKGWAIPTHVYDYQRKLASIHDPYNWAPGNWLARWHHRWRTLTLTYMPRWALNTAIGSFLLSGITGNVRLSDYRMAAELRKQGKLPPGVDQRVLSVRDYMEPAMQGQLRGGQQAMMGNIGEAKMPTRQILRNVQGIEDFFRGAQFVRQLRKEANLPARDMGQTLKEFWNDLDDKPFIDQWLEDPKLVARAIEETNKLSYAYGSLTPFERRYLRTFVPFWGWYKFISKFAWRLPIEHPGKANIISQLSQIGQMREDEFGMLPTWIKGSILLNLAGGKLQYISTLGANPLSEFMNPLKAGSLFKLSQTTPLFQASLSAFGYDTLRGGEVAISPDSARVSRGLFGDLVNIDTGQSVNLMEHKFWQRFMGGLLRSVPQIRIAEQMQAGGPVYPESIPVLSERPYPRPEDFQKPSALDMLGAYGGVNVREYPLRKYQEMAANKAGLSKTMWLRNRRRIRETNR